MKKQPLYPMALLREMEIQETIEAGREAIAGMGLITSNVIPKNIIYLNNPSPSGSQWYEIMVDFQKETEKAFSIPPDMLGKPT